MARGRICPRSCSESGRGRGSLCGVREGIEPSSFSYSLSAMSSRME
jgi:hypothetical protein